MAVNGRAEVNGAPAARALLVVRGELPSEGVAGVEPPTPDQQL